MWKLRRIKDGNATRIQLPLRILDNRHNCMIVNQIKYAILYYASTFLREIYTLSVDEIFI